MKEEYERKLQEAEAKKIAEAEEKKRKESIIKSYLDKLEAQLKEKKILGFWTFVDRAGFRKYNSSEKSIIKMINAEPDKYLDRQIADYTIKFHQNEKPDSHHREIDIWFTIAIRIYNIIENKNKLELNLFNDCVISWRVDDFKITKFSLKLMEMLMKPLAEKKLSLTSLMGHSVKNALKRYEDKAGIDFSEVLQPLKGL